ncbi:MAG TPA: Os1348 family NHLP clan protein [Candidatus Acidoferrum sp.]|nr:Os1348 family NHLP clan protein [Candidatus Acidoferrum sp.]
MSQAAVERTLGKLITDECFRDRFFKNPAAASFHAGLELSRAELDALSRLPEKPLAEFSAWIDDRIRRLAPVGEEPPT